ncbi:MAG: hypothetical protein US98_C0028G0006 [Parcubacteria group bacterium GW2011_GWC1_38_6]|nr:MAG: hypothetical protein US98_C0028G0006 [Parcubacteria group bacterium GW2011_GWC1_38_6]
MDKKVYNYRILVEKEKTKQGVVFVSYVPTLGISDFGKTIDETVLNTEKAIKIYLKTQASLKREIPQQDNDEYFIVNKKVELNYPNAAA